MRFEVKMIRTISIKFLFNAEERRRKGTERATYTLCDSATRKLCVKVLYEGVEARRRFYL